jgi:hypothetical protein
MSPMEKGHVMITARQRPKFLNAITAYARWCTQRRVLYVHPNAELSSVGWKYVHLRNINGLLARYNFRIQRIVTG